MLSLENLSFTYQTAQNSGSDLNIEYALRDISLDFQCAPVIGLIGANGSGKSTLLMNLLGLLRPQQGCVKLDGQALSYSKSALRALRQRVSLVFQDPEQQIFYTDIESDIAFSLRNLDVAEAEIKRRVDEALSLVDAQSFRHKPVQYLSYGQKKRVAIAGALVLNAEYLLLDEPTAGLDPAGRAAMIKIIEKIAASGSKIMISSHDIDLIYQICDYLYVLEKGKICASGTERSVFLQTDLLKRAGLTQPWLVKMHLHLGVPLYKTEAEFFQSTNIKNTLSTNQQQV